MLPYLILCYLDSAMSHIQPLQVINPICTNYIVSARELCENHVCTDDIVSARELCENHVCTHPLPCHLYKTGLVPT